MQRIGFTMRLKPGNEEEYRKRHDDIWPELVDLLRAKGLKNYSIFRSGLDLFGYVETDNPMAMLELPQEDLMQKWWTYMEPLMECNEDASPKITLLEESFHMD